MLSAAMFMTHGYGKLFGENPQPYMSGGITTINIADLVSWPIPMDIIALFVVGVVEFFGGLLILIGLWTHLAAFLVIFSFGPGPYSADTWFSLRRQEKRKNKMDTNKL